jgi:hypothetical protein
MSTAAIAHQAAPGHPYAADVLLHAVADGLGDHGVDIRGPAWESTHHFKATNVLGVRCEFIVHEDGSVTWDYCPIWDCRKEPAQVTVMVLELLGVRGAADGAMPAGGYLGRTLMGAVGRAARLCGMNTLLSIVGMDHADCEVLAEVQVTNPARPGHGAVYVTSDDAIRWECGRTDSGRGTLALTPEEITATIARSLPRNALPASPAAALAVPR